MSNDIVLKVQNLKKYFGSVKAIDNISFEVEKGEIFGFLGPNGAGKTTTIRLLLDFIRAQSGSVEIFEIKSTESNFYEARKKIGYLIAGTNLVESWTGRDHIDYQQALFGHSKILLSLLKRFEFDTSPRVKTLSTGNRQKLGLIMALMHEPELLVMDEPTVGLDPMLQEEVYRIFKRLSQKGVTIFMSSHNLPEVEKVCTRVAMIKEGKLITVRKISDLEGKKIHSVRIVFDEPIDQKNIEDKNIKVVKEIEDGLQISVKGDIDSFIKKIAKLKVKTIQISQANLEEIFFEFYRK